MTKFKQINVVYLINGLNPGGGERMLQQLAMALALHSIDVSIYCLSRLGSVADELRLAGINVTLLRGPQSWRAFWQALQRAYILHTHFFYSDLLGWFLGKAARVPYLISTRHETGFWMRPWHRWLERRFYGRFDKILCVSQAVSNSLKARHMPSARLSVIPPGVHVDKLFHRRIGAHRQRIIVSVGRLETVKGHDVLLRALATMERNFKLYLVGDGSQRRRLEDLAEHLHIKHLCEFAGTQNSQIVRRYLQQADLFVLPSRSEGLPLSLLEAMAAELACIASATGGMDEVIVDRVTGILVPPDDVSALAKMLVILLDNAALRQQLGQQARAFVEANYSIDAFIQKTKEIYEQAVLAKKR
jgi:glycosyltransferase involved in cell wall biosynthesis